MVVNVIGVFEPNDKAAGRFGLSEVGWNRAEASQRPILAEGPFKVYGQLSDPPHKLNNPDTGNNDDKNGHPNDDPDASKILGR